ncbi:hypothetical protein [Haliangium ochraceum]|uniref:Uncharacterized protein n=1 Tax=Haliangium ochraceum (strain DSM 14365 / JCM 11303 / SMP-2) TaxID=502025 RepID=D0LL30_HALO1|nr:hypothetical protein [Haliangium ochraceum]ACY16750.1 hypothetical protein Hoch_4253 [Haliangium ochraceum DSM 14365]
MEREVLADGTLRLRADDAALTITRLRPGVLWLVAAGGDHSALTPTMLAELSAELRRFPDHLSLFIDTRRMDFVGQGARTAWTRWSEAQPREHVHTHMLVTSKLVHLIVAVAEHEAGRPIEILDDPDAFAAAVQAQAPEWRDVADVLLSAPAVAIARSQHRDAVALGDGHCAATVHRLAGDALRITLTGNDRGAITCALFDELAEAVGPERPQHIFIDLSGADMPRGAVSELWTAWFSAARPAVKSVAILASSPGVYLTAAIAQWRSHTGGLIRVFEDPARFDAAVARAGRSAPGSAPG